MSLFALSAALLLGGGCGVHPGGSAGAVATADVIHARQARADAALAKLGQTGEHPPRVWVLETAGVGAFAWRDGRLYVTRALVDLLDDRELSAALAHELGHLLNDGYLQSVASLRGTCTDPDIEARADATGSRLLRQQNIDVSSMITMLEKVRSCPSSPPACRSSLARRIELLKHPS